LKVRVGKVSQSTTDEEDGVKTGTQTGGIGTACLGGSGLGGGLGCRVAGLALDGADEEALEDFAGFVAVADVFEGFGGVLAADVEHYFFTTAVVGGWLAWCFPCFLCLERGGDVVGVGFLFLVILCARVGFWVGFGRELGGLGASLEKLNVRGVEETYGCSSTKLVQL